MKHVVNLHLFDLELDNVEIRRKLRQSVLSQHINIQPEDICFEHEAFGKPIIAPPHDETLKFSESHSIGIYGIATSPTSQIGFDVESIRDFKDSDKWISDAFCHSELQEFNKLPKLQQSRAILQQWTRKESILKAWGVGLSYSPLKIDLSKWAAKNACDYTVVVVEGTPVSFTDIMHINKGVGTIAIWNSKSRIKIMIQ